MKKKKQTFAWSTTYLNEWKHFEIIRCTVKLLVATPTYFFVEVQLKRKLKMCFFGVRVWAPKPVCQSSKWLKYVSDIFPWSWGQVMLRDKLKPFYVLFHKAYKHQTRYSGDLGQGLSLSQVPMTLDHVVTCHITNKRCSISSSTRPITKELGIVVTNLDRLFQVNSDDPFLEWPLEVSWQIKKTLHLFFQVTFKGQDLGWGTSSYQVMNHFIARSVANKKFRWKFRFFYTRFWNTTFGWEETHSETLC